MFNKNNDFDTNEETSFKNKKVIKKDNTKNLYVFLALVLILFIGICFYYYSNKTENQNIEDENFTENNVSVTTTSDNSSSINKIIGLENIEISEYNVINKETTCIIELNFFNNSNEKNESCKIHIYLLDENNTIIFGTLIDLPQIDAKSNEKMKIQCSENIPSNANLRIITENEEKK